MNNLFNQDSTPVRIAVITSDGGSEHAVSLRSAENVSRVLLRNFAKVQAFPFDAGLKDALLAWKPDVVFPVAHGDGETGELQALLETMGLVFVGSDATASALCWDKVAANRSAVEWTESSQGIVDIQRFAVPSYVALSRGDDIRETVKKFCAGFPDGGSVVIKPAKEGSSCGISFSTLPSHKALTSDEVIQTINGSIGEIRIDRIVQGVEEAFGFDRSVIVQKAIRGTEITVGILEAPDPHALPVVEIVTPRGSWYDYDHKYSAGGSEHIIPARLPDAWLKFSQDVAVALHRHLGCSDYSRIDFIVEKDEAEAKPICLWFLEINTLPGFTSTSLFPDAAKAAGYSMPELVKGLVLNAWERRPA